MSWVLVAYQPWLLPIKIRSRRVIQFTMSPRVIYGIMLCRAYHYAMGQAKLMRRIHDLTRRCMRLELYSQIACKLLILLTCLCKHVSDTKTGPVSSVAFWSDLSMIWPTC